MFVSLVRRCMKNRIFSSNYKFVFDVNKVTDNNIEVSNTVKRDLIDKSNTYECDGYSEYCNLCNMYDVYSEYNYTMRYCNLCLDTENWLTHIKEIEMEMEKD